MPNNEIILPHTRKEFCRSWKYSWFTYLYNLCWNPSVLFDDFNSKI